MSNRILITGSNGLLGQKIVKHCVEQEIEFLATSSGGNRNDNCADNNFKELDITAKERLEQLVSDFRPTAIINTAAMTNVDACESDTEKCYNINVLGVQNLYEICSQNNIHLVHLSTDFVFDGEKGNYSEEDEINPLSVYGKSKSQSEAILAKSGYDNWSILRTIIVYGKGSNLSRSNLVLWAKKALGENEELKIVNDQFRSLTWADDLALACLSAVQRNARGIFHISGEEVHSILDWVKIIAKHYDFSTDKIKEISTESLSQAAPRPPKTGFDLSKSKHVLGYRPTPFLKTLELLDRD